MKALLLRILPYALPVSIMLGIDGTHAHSLAEMSSEYWYVFPLVLLFYALTIYFKLAKTRFSQTIVKHGNALMLATDVLLMTALFVHRFYPPALLVLDWMIHVLLIFHAHHIINCISAIYKKFKDKK